MKLMRFPLLTMLPACFPVTLFRTADVLHHLLANLELCIPNRLTNHLVSFDDVLQPVQGVGGEAMQFLEQVHDLCGGLGEGVRDTDESHHANVLSGTTVCDQSQAHTQDLGRGSLKQLTLVLSSPGSAASSR
eukprot:scaffold91_cov254-Pinguiococcus_pyrenoidosus.AAC.8